MAEDLIEDMDDGEDGQGTEDAGTPKKKSRLKKMVAGKKKLLLILLILLILAGSAGGAWFFFFGQDSESVPDTPADTPLTEEEIQAALESPAEPIFEDIIVLAPFERIQLKGTSAMGRISLDISLELIDENDRRLFYPMEERVRKIVEGQVRELTWLELRTPEGKIRLKYDLLKRVNSIFNKPMIRNLYFTNFIMQ